MDETTQDLIEKLPFQINEYQFLKFVGNGMFSSVFEVHSTKYNRRFAAKMTELDESLISEEGIHDPELAALFSLDHPNVIKFYDYFIFLDRLVLILDYCHGGTLQKFIGLNIPPPLTHCLVKNIVDGLNYCHTQKIAHRDLKPANIFVNQGNHAILGDFGFASFHTLVDQACGSPFYCAPEIFRSEVYDPFMADIFALGVTLFELLTGKVPFTEEQLRFWDEEKLNDICNIDSLNNVAYYKSKYFDHDLMAMIMQMLRYNPLERPTMREILCSNYFKSTFPKTNMKISNSSLPRLHPPSEERFTLTKEAKKSPLFKSAILPISATTSLNMKRRKPIEHW